MRYSRIGMIGTLVTAMALGACSSDSEKKADSKTNESSSSEKKASKPSGTTTLSEADQEAPGCDAIDTTACLLPFPSDSYTKADADSPTGKVLHFEAETMPKNKDGIGINPTEWNNLDGFSPGSPILVRFPGLSLEKSKAAPITDIGSSLDDDAPIVLLDMDTEDRVPYWAELDEQATKDDPILFVRPARNFLEGHRIAVGFRNLVDDAGTAITPSPAFVAYQKNLDTGIERIEARRPAMEDVFEALDKEGFERDGLIAAWDFTVASQESLSGTVLHMRDTAFEELGDSAPKFTVSEVVENPDPLIARSVTGTFEVPNFLEGDGSPGSRMVRNDEGLPTPTDTPFQADFTCTIPASALTGSADAPAAPARPVIYGHGLLGGDDEVDASNIKMITSTYNFVYCATKWSGFSEDDVSFAVKTLQDFSNFPAISERSQQGFINQLFLARLMKLESGLVTDPSFQTAEGNPAIDAGGELYYDGNSQGGIMGGALTSISTEWTKAVLGVPGMNYTTLLNRSIDFDTYKAVLDPSYPDPVVRTLALVFAQQFWDRFETNGYAQHLISDPYEGTPEHQVLMHVAVGDHQVSQYAADVMARTIGAKRIEAELREGRSSDKTPLWGIDIATLPSSDSIIIYVDSDQPLPPLGNIPPTEGKDSHGDPRADPEVMKQKDAFFRPDGKIIDTCDGAPCLAVSTKK